MLEEAHCSCYCCRVAVAIGVLIEEAAQRPVVDQTIGGFQREGGWELIFYLLLHEMAIIPCCISLGVE